jgi:hypothetical protein
MVINWRSEMKRLLIYLLLLLSIDVSGQLVMPGVVASSKVPSPLLTGLVAYYKCDETSGTTIVDEQGNQNGTTDGTVNVAGILGRALSFDASGEEMTIAYNANISLAGCAATSVSVWINITATAGTETHNSYIIRFINTAAPTTAFAIYQGSVTNKIYTGITNSGNTTTYANTTSAYTTTGVWIHIVSIAEADVANKIYINGVNVANAPGTFTGVFAQDNVEYVGNNGVEHFNGLIDEIGIWHRVLTPTEVGQLYNSGSGYAYPFN